MDKWNEPKGPIPHWLDAADEVTRDDPKLGKSEFIVACVDALLALGCSIEQACGVTANALNETGWGQFYRANNLGGWKLTKAGAEAFRAVTGHGPMWWRAPGNMAPGATLADYAGGDPPWCYYRAFLSIGDFLGEWLAHFVPTPGLPAPYAIYKACGEAFWHGEPWFPLLVAAGYKGENTRKHPDNAIAEHAQLRHAAATRWGQTVLRVPADGQWGTISKTACAVYQRAHGLAVTGELDAATLTALADARP